MGFPYLFCCILACRQGTKARDIGQSLIFDNAA
jgi:hypothetical protein